MLVTPSVKIDVFSSHL